MKSQGTTDIGHGFLFKPICWTALLVSTLAFYIVPVPGTGYYFNISLFDPVALLVFAAVAWRGGFRRFPAGFLIAAAVLLAAVASHSLLIFLQYEPGLNVAWLLRGTIKFGIIVVLFVVLLLAFRSDMLGGPPVNFQRILFAACILTGLIWNHLDPPFTPNTLLVANNWLFFFLFLLGQKWPFSAWRLGVNLCIAAILAVVSLILLSKVGAIIGVLAIASLAVFHLREEKIANMLPIAFAVSAAAIAIVYALLDQTALLYRLDSVFQSVSIRVSLWSLALAGIADTFPLGVGLDQFVTLVARDPALFAQQHKFPHSVPLGLIVELGLLGVAIAGLMTVLLWRAAHGYPAYLRPVFFAILIPLALLHDIQGVRLLLLVTAYGYAKWSASRINVTVGGAMETTKS